MVYNSIKESDDGKSLTGTQQEVCKFLVNLMDVLEKQMQEPKTGHWIFDKTLDEHYYCSECKSMGVDYWDFCPYCGCAMKGE